MFFDGKSKSLRGGLWLRVDGNRIKRIASGDQTPPEGVRMIDCGRRVMMPGLIDAHWHSIFAALPVSALVSADVGYIFLATSSKAERTLLRGFTTVRDLGVFCFEASDRLEVDKRAASPLDPFDFSGT
jgi:imidazolonepropionase-like amidohydrolase